MAERLNDENAQTSHMFHGRGSFFCFVFQTPELPISVAVTSGGQTEIS